MPFAPRRRRPQTVEPDQGNALSDWISFFITNLGRLVALLAGIALIAIVIDQVRHFNDDYKAQQRLKHQFMCYSHSREITIVDRNDETEKKRAQIERRIYSLMDAVRQQNAPTEFLGKLRHFSLCSSFSKVGIGGFEAASSGAGTKSVVAMDSEDADELIGSLRFFVEEYPDFPIRTARKLRLQLAQLIEIDAQITQAEGTPEKTPTSDTGSATVDDSWLLVVGADQTDDAAASQVRITRNILANAGVTSIADAPVELRLIRSWRRTVVVFPDQTAADAALEALKDQLPFGGYVREQASWCPDLGPAAAPVMLSDKAIPTKICEAGK